MFWAFDNVNWEALWAAFRFKVRAGCEFHVEISRNRGGEKKKTELAEQAVSNGVLDRFFPIKILTCNIGWHAHLRHLQLFDTSG